ncbi:DUF4391 domain-containing protein [Thermoanaerobacterium sp. R66]|uniref:DUF4391 domain-containing protein n=1 Tax=Thermoanaerobacterium sp. R66 TaxID=2742479 RepID=UPI0023806698|nr:DUF4391 domain-containing protein [Thermoanaerobacterium sp. R66]MDE4541244.1 DUF4391 domain-containing protein [Thermoanaerobacterium sp. R66]
MDDYSFLNIPDSCFIGSTIYKKLFYENANLSSSDKYLFTDIINKIVWLYCLKPETINIPAYKDEVREYPEIEVIEVIVNKDYGLNRIAEIIMRTIPYPMLLIFKLEDKRRFYVAHQRTSQSDSSKNTVEEFISTDWLESDSALFSKLDIKQMRFTNFYTLYSDIVDAISVYNLSTIMPMDDTITGTEARELTAKIEDIEQKIISLRSKLKKETQFNCKMELNIEIKRLEQSKNKLLGGDNE